MKTYYISYSVMSDNGSMVGTGSAIMERFEVPRSIADVNRLAQDLNDQQDRLGLLRSGEYLGILGWSEMRR